MANIKRAVTFYSLQDQYARKKMTLKEIARYVKGLGAEMEFIPDQMMHGTPHPAEATLKAWDEMVQETGIIPAVCGSYVNDKLYKNRLLTVKEGAANLIGELELAHRLGFPMVKLVSTTRTGIVEAALPTAERLGITITSEIHGGMSFNMPYVQEYVELLNRLQSPYLGFTIDCGIFCRRHPRVSTNYFKAIGMDNPYIVDYINGIFAEGKDPNSLFMAHPEVMEHLMSKATCELDQLYIVYSTGYDNNPYTILDDYLPWVKHIHGKVYEMTDEGPEYSIDYAGVVEYLKSRNYEGYISTEYEGNRFTPPGVELKEKQQVERHQALLKKCIEG